MKPYYLRDASEGGEGVSEKHSDKFSLLVYGEFGTGKTVSAYSFPKPLGISLDKGESTVRSWGLDVPPPQRFFYGKPIFRNLIALINDARDGTGPWFGPGGKYADRETLIIDTGTELSDFLTYELMKLETHKDKGGNPMNWAPEDNPPAWDHYALLTSRMEAIGRALRDLKETRMNVVMTCLGQIEVDKAGSPIAGYPMLTGKTRSKIAAWFDEVYWMTKEKVGVSGAKFIAYPYDIGLWKCKSRFGFTKPIENLTYKTIIDMAMSSKPQTPGAAAAGGTATPTTQN